MRYRLEAAADPAELSLGGSAQAASVATSLRVLVVEDSLADAELLLMELRRGGYDVSYERYTTEPEVRAALKTGTWDLIVSDYSLPGFDGMRCLQLYRESGLDIPFILMSGTVGEEIAVEAMKSGAHDYIMKDRLVRLVPAIKRELREVVARRERKSFMEHMEFIAYHDPVTRLPNQRLFLQEVEHAIRKCASHPGSRLAIAIPEIAKFKEIRTTVTQADYDTLMRQIADRLWMRCEGMLSLSRIDDYTFAAMFTVDKSVDPEAVGRGLLAAFDEPYEIDPFLLHLDASVGLALHSPEIPAAGMLRNAIVAANQARDKRQPHAVYSLSEDLSSPGNLALLGQLRDAIRSGELACTTSPSWTWAAAASPRWKPWSAGTTRPSACSSPRSSWGWPRAPTSSSHLPLGWWMRPFHNGANGMKPV